MQHKFKQIYKYAEIVESLIKPIKFDGTVHIADMGAGKGYLTFALHELLTQRLNLDVDIKGVEIVNIKDSEIEDALAYLHGHLEGEVGLWTEDEVKDKLKDWRMSKSVPPQPTTPATIPSKPSHIPSTPPSNPEQMRLKRYQALQRVNVNPNLKSALARLIDNEDGYIIDILLKYV